VDPPERLLHLLLSNLILLDELAEGPSNPLHPPVEELLLDVPHRDDVTV
jgi:hypothetical protein